MLAIKPLSNYLKNNSPFKNIGLIGLDFALEKINLVQLGELDNGDLALKSVCSLPYEETREELLSSPKLLRKKIKNAFPNNSFVGKKVITSIPSDNVRIISVHYKKPKDAQDSAPVIQAIKQRIDDDLSNYVIDYLPVRADDTDTDQLAIVALVKNEIITTYLEALRHAGLVVENLEIRPAAINRFVYSNLERGDYQNILVANLGQEHSFLTITSGRRLLFDQQIEFGSTKLIDEM